MPNDADNVNNVPTHAPNNEVNIIEDIVVIS